MLQIEVTFDIDANGIVNVSAKDKATGNEKTVRIEASGGLSEADIQRLVREAEANAEHDRRRRELAEARNQGDGAVYTAEKALKAAEGRVPANVKAEVEQAIAAPEDTLQGEDLKRIGHGGHPASFFSPASSAAAAAPTCACAARTCSTALRSISSMPSTAPPATSRCRTGPS